MKNKIDKGYLGKTLSHLDMNGNKIIEQNEWGAFFNQYQGTILKSATSLVTYILHDIMNAGDGGVTEHIATLANEIIKINSEKDTPFINLDTLHTHITQLIAPINFRKYQQTLSDTRRFFLYDGIVERCDFDIFTDDNHRMHLCDIYYLIIALNITPKTAFAMLNYLTQEPSIQYNPDDFTLDAYRVFDVLAIQKYDSFVIDIDALVGYIKDCQIEKNDQDIIKLFDIHHTTVEHLSTSGLVNYEMAFNFFNFYHKDCLELGIKSLFNGLSIALHDTHDLINLIDFLGYQGNPHKIFREFAGINDTFSPSDVKNFLNDNRIKYDIKEIF